MMKDDFFSIGEIAKILKGSKAPEVFDQPRPGAYPYVQIEDLRPDAKPKYAIDKDGILATKTDVLIAWDGANAGTIGFGLEGYIGSTIAILRPIRDDIHAPYLGYFLRSKFEDIQENTTGATIPHVNRDYLENLKLPLPPLTEQKRIASLLARADHLRQLRRAARRLADSLLQSVFLEMFGKVRGKTKEAKLGDISDIASGVTKGQNYNGRKTVEVPYLRVANVQDGYLDLSEIKTIQALPSEVEELRLQVGDVVMTEGGDFDKLGRGAIWRGQIENCIHQNHIFRVRLDKAKVLPDFFENYLLSPEAKKYFLGASKQTTNLASINMTQLKQLPVPLYPLPLQEEFARVAARVEALRARQAEAERQAEGLFQSLLALSFTEGLEESFGGG